MPLPTEPVTLTVEQIGELNNKLASLRHDVNNNLSLIIAAMEIIRVRPERAEALQKELADKPHKIAAAMTQFSGELEKALRLRHA